MEQEGPPVYQYAVHLLTRTFQFSGQLEVIGEILNFLNDPMRDALILRQAYIAPLTPGGPIRGLARPQISVRRQEVVFLYLGEATARAEVRLLARKELLVVYTPLAVLRGVFHLPAEAPVSDFLASMPGAFVPVTRANIFLLLELPSAFPTECDLLLVGRQHIQLHHLA